MLELGVIADDLTGGMMVASLLEREGVRCPLVTSVDALARVPEDAEAIVIGRKLRIADAQAARVDARACAEALLARGAKRLYYKYSALFMSTPQGNIGPVTEELMAAAGTDRVLFVPTWSGCTIYLGRLFVNNIMLHESGASRDPVTPMTNSNLVEVLQTQSQVAVGLLPLRELHRGIKSAQSFLDEQVGDGKSFFIADAIAEDDVDRLAALAFHMPVATGADWLPVYLARHWRDGQTAPEERRLLPPAPGLAAVLAGSCSPKSNRQLKQFEAKHPLYRVDLPALAADPGVFDEIVEWVSSRIHAGPVGISTTTDPVGVERAHELLGRDGAAALADDLLGRLAKRLYEMGVRKFVVAGGETSGTVLNALGIDQTRVSSFDHLGGGYCHAAGDEPISLVTKAGGQGDEDFFEAALNRLQEADAADH